MRQSAKQYYVLSDVILSAVFYLLMNAGWHYPEFPRVVMLSFVMLNVVLLNVVMLNVVMPNVIALIATIEKVVINLN